MKLTTEKRASPSFSLVHINITSNKPIIFLIGKRLLKQLNKEDIMFTKLKQIIKPKELNKYTEKKELSPKQEWLRDNTPVTKQHCISDLRYYGLIK